MKQDRFLMTILGVIVVLIIASLLVFFLRQEPQEYSTENTPKGVVLNYVLSLQNGDYQRAYGYIQSAEDKPSFTAFYQSLQRDQQEFSRAAIKLGDVTVSGDSVLVDITIIHTSEDPFDRTWVENDTTMLIKQEGEWRIVNMPYPYWGWDWYTKR